VETEERERGGGKGGGRETERKSNGEKAVAV